MNRNKKCKVLRISVALLLILGVILTALVYHFGWMNLRPTNMPEENDVKIACVGDSITYGKMVFGWPGKTYPAVLGEMLGKGYCVNNYGVAGTTATKDPEHSYIRTEAYISSKEFQPDYVVIMLGTNDSATNKWQGKEKYKDDYGYLIDEYKALKSVKNVFIMTPPPAYEWLGKVRYSIQKDLVKSEINEAVRELAAEKNIMLIDIYSELAGREELFFDGVHPNVNGARVIAEKVKNEFYNLQAVC